MKTSLLRRWGVWVGVALTALSLHFNRAEARSWGVPGKTAILPQWPLSLPASVASLQIGAAPGGLKAADHLLPVGPVVFPEFGIDSPAIGHFDHIQPSVAWNGSVYLVVWADARNEGQYNIYGSLFDARGIPASPAGIPIRRGARSHYVPAVASDGNGFVVAWVEYPQFGRVENELLCARVDVTSSRQITVSSPTTVCRTEEKVFHTQPSLAYNGRHFLVFWTRHFFETGQSVVLAARFTPNLQVVDPGGFPVSRTGSGHVAGSVASRGGEFLVVWAQYGDWETGPVVWGARVADSGQILDPEGIVLGWGARPCVASDGATYLLTWQDGLAPQGGIYGRGLAADGSPMGPDAVRVGPEGYWPRAAWNGAAYLVGWANSEDRYSGSDIHAARVSSSGQLLDAAGITVCQAPFGQIWPAVASDGQGWLVVWEDLREDGTHSHVYGARIGADGAVKETDGVGISPTSGYHLLQPSVAFNGTVFLVVWPEVRTNYTFNLYGARVTAGGQVLDPTGFLVARDSGGGEVTSNGRDFLVAWARLGDNSCDLLATRVTAEGTVLDPQGIPVSIGPGFQSGPVAASDGQDYLVAWTDTRNASGPYSNNYDIYAARVTAAGSVLDPAGIPIANSPASEMNATVAGNGSGYLVVWTHGMSADGNIHGARVSTTGTILDASPLRICTVTNHQVNPRAASDGQDFLVVWRDQRERNNTDIYAARVTGQGLLADPDGFPVVTGSDYESYPCATAWGGGYLVAWQCDSPGSGPGVARIRGARVSRSGLVLDPAGWVINDAPFPQRTPAASAAGNGAALVVSEGARDGAFHVVGNLVFPDPRPVAYPQSVTVQEDQAAPLTLTAYDSSGNSLTYQVAPPSHGTLAGTPPDLTYIPHPNYFGSDSFTFTVHNGLNESEPATVALTILAVNDPPVADASATCVRLISGNNVDAPAWLDGSASRDVEGDPLTYLWLDEASQPVGSGVRVRHVFAVGRHALTLLVSDGAPGGTVADQFTLEIVTAADATAALGERVEQSGLPRQKVQPLVASLQAAMEAFAKGRFETGANLLGVFQKKVQTQVAPINPWLASALIKEAQLILDAVSAEGIRGRP